MVLDGREGSPRIRTQGQAAAEGVLIVVDINRHADINIMVHVYDYILSWPCPTCSGAFPCPCDGDCLLTSTEADATMSINKASHGKLDRLTVALGAAPS